MKKSVKTKKAFTLMEVLLYVSIVSIMLVVLSTFLAAISQSRVRSQVIADVNEQGVQIMQLITQTVRNATSITVPAAAGSGSTLTVVVPTGSLSPTTFDLSSGVMRIKEGAGAVVNLTSNRVTVSSLTFTNLTRTGTFGTVRIQFTLAHTNPDNRKEFSYSETFYGTATLR